MKFRVEGKVFFHVLKGYNNFLGAKKTIFKSRYGLRDFRFMF
jgi:hypothetical protein